MMLQIQKSFEFNDEYKIEVQTWYEEILPLYKKGYQLANLA